jgi:hypothetical protein
MIMAALAIIQALIWVGVGIDKFFICIGTRNILDTTITWSGNILVSGWLFGWLSVSLHFCNGLYTVIGWKNVHRRNGTELRIKASFVSCFRFNE